MAYRHNNTCKVIQNHFQNTRKLEIYHSVQQFSPIILTCQIKKYHLKIYFFIFIFSPNEMILCLPQHDLQGQSYKNPLQCPISLIFSFSQHLGNRPKVSFYSTCKCHKKDNLHRKVKQHTYRHNIIVWLSTRWPTYYGQHMWFLS